MGGRNRVAGQVLPPGPARIETRGARAVTVTADPLGRFALDEVLPGAFSVRCVRGPDAFTTEWITI
jgi:hypothetical protein